MPEYVYDCLECKTQSHIRHRYKAPNVTCIKCGSLKLIPNLSTPFNHVPTAKGRRPVAGDEVKQAIENNSVELKQIKKKFANRVYKKS
jgi:DNA-directed RNA polymerase subunit RPC12/RpoP